MTGSNFSLTISLILCIFAIAMVLLNTPNNIVKHLKNNNLNY